MLILERSLQRNGSDSFSVCEVRRESVAASQALNLDSRLSRRDDTGAETAIRLPVDMLAYDSQRTHSHISHFSRLPSR